jgi:hypothetical protein
MKAGVVEGHFPYFGIISIGHRARLPKYLYVGQAKSIA